MGGYIILAGVIFLIMILNALMVVAGQHAKEIKPLEKKIKAMDEDLAIYGRILFKINEQSKNNLKTISMKTGDFITVVPDKNFELNFGKERKKELDRIDGAKLIQKNKYTSLISYVEREKNGIKVVKLITVLNDVLVEIIKEGSKFWEDLKFLFSAIPERIEHYGVQSQPDIYFLTLQPANGMGIDKVFYLSPAKSILVETEGETMASARIAMREKLKELNYL